jgi:excisionase family DNA binding protein
MSLIDDLKRRKQYLTTMEVMALLQLPRNTVCGWARAGRIPAVLTASGYRFDPMELALWIVARTTSPRQRVA